MKDRIANLINSIDIKKDMRACGIISIDISAALNSKEVHLSREEFLKNFSEGFECKEHDEIYDKLEIEYKGVYFFALEKKEIEDDETMEKAID